MNEFELIERYVHQVGRYLPPNERAEIEAELRSQIADKLDDRYAESPTQEQVAAVLAELGHPYLIAASYNSERYLVGPLLYPYLMLVLRRGWLIIPAIVVFMSIFGALTSSEASVSLRVIIETSFAAIQGGLIFTAVVVLFFAILQRTYLQSEQAGEPFNPLELPEVDDPGAVDRFETTFSLIFGFFVTLVLLYWLYVGGLTLRFNLSDPGEVIPVPAAWLLLLIIAAVGQIIMNLVAVRNKRWSVSTLLAETVLEIVGTIALYFAITQPFVERLILDHPNLMFMERLPELFAILYAVPTLINRGSTLVRLWGYRSGSTPPFAVQVDTRSKPQ